ncbi:hypothetical protein GCM10010515_55010 [Streptomyces fructofermentans]|uniref:MacB-like periplasmic core domain-containing protein n=1 Tax=Streptomyces fructofermentans TaxID=152141 RepID=A0A918NM74_9ACTN|nr:hypothetical protein GCM10010515_55010 [Streptomyces fructofermentans]
MTSGPKPADRRPVRTALTMLGVVLGVGTVVAVLGMTASATGQISERFNALTATEVTVSQPGDARPEDLTSTGSLFPRDADARAARVNGVRSAGTYSALSAERVGDITGVPLPGAPSQQLPVIAASAGTLPALRADVRAGRLYDAALEDRAEPVAVLGSGAARRLGISGLDGQPVVFVGGTPLTVIGIVDDVERKSEVLASVIVPSGTALHLWGPPGKRDEPARMIVDTELGAADDVAAQLPLALRPDRPDVLRATAPPRPHTLRNDIATDLNSLFLLLAGVSLAIGTVGIANTTLIAVLERTSEIGLRGRARSQAPPCDGAVPRGERADRNRGRPDRHRRRCHHRHRGRPRAALDARPAQRDSPARSADRHGHRPRRRRLSGPARRPHRARGRVQALKRPRQAGPAVRRPPSPGRGRHPRRPPALDHPATGSPGHRVTGSPGHRGTRHVLRRVRSTECPAPEGAARHLGPATAGAHGLPSLP